jgi:hypothetical protein
MSDAPIDYTDPAVMRALLVKIDRDRAETQQLLAEVGKLNAEGHKFNRVWWIVPLTLLGAIIAGIVARLPEILHAFRIGAP